MKKSIFICFLSLLFFSKNHVQAQCLGVKASMGMSYLYPKYSLNPTKSLIYPLNSNIEVNYLLKKDDKTAFLIGAGVEHQLYYSQYEDDFFPEAQYIEDYLYLKIPFQYRRNLKDWFYVGGGMNTAFTVISTTHNPQLGMYESYFRPALGQRNFQLELTGTAGVQFDFWKFSYHLGVITEIPVIHHEYFNLGLDTGLYFNF